jgi:hypothetical protein
VRREACGVRREACGVRREACRALPTIALAKVGAVSRTPLAFIPYQLLAESKTVIGHFYMGEFYNP